MSTFWPGASVKAPVCGFRQMFAWIDQPFLIDLAATPVPPEIVPSTVYSVDGAGQAFGDVVVTVMPVSVVVPVPFQVMVPLPEAIDDVGNVPLPPVFFLSVHPDRRMFLAFALPASFAQEAFTVGVLAEAGPAKATLRDVIGNTKATSTNNKRRMHPPFG
jgi:hypothetical protein